MSQIKPIPGNPYGLALDTCPKCKTKEMYLAHTNQGWMCLPCLDRTKSGVVAPLL